MFRTSIASHVLRLRTTIPEFFAWWGAALSGLVPESWRRAWDQRRARLTLELSATEVVLRRRARGRETILFCGSRDDLSSALSDSSARSAPGLIVALAPDLVFRRTVLLPAAAEANLTRVMANEIDRQTPFSAGQVYFDYRIASRDGASGQLAVELVVAKHAIIDDIRGHAARLSLDLTAVGVAGPAPGDRQIDLLARSPDATAHSPTFWVNVGLTVFAGLLAIAVGTEWLERLDSEIDRLSMQVKEVRAQAQQADALRREIARLADAATFLVRRKDEPSALTVLREVTALLPDDAWTYEFQLVESQVRIAGYAADAPGLIGRLEGSLILRDPRFRAPVTRIANPNVDRFDLSADVRALQGRAQP